MKNDILDSSWILKDQAMYFTFLRSKFDIFIHVDTYDVSS